jgi:hypothetical protein
VSLRPFGYPLGKKEEGENAHYRGMKEGFPGGGSKAERKLGIPCTPVRIALEEAIASYAQEA